MKAWVITMVVLLGIDTFGKILQTLMYEHVQKPPRWSVTLDLLICVIMLTWYFVEVR